MTHPVSSQDLLRWAEALAGIAQTGLAFSEVQFERDRYREVINVAADIKARGGALTSEPADQPWGARDFSVEDPDGYKITISSDVSGG